jgi:hypothetical protein
MKLLSLVGLPAAIIFSDPLTEAISDRLFSLRLFRGNRVLYCCGRCLARAGNKTSTQVTLMTDCRTSMISSADEQAKTTVLGAEIFRRRSAA